MFYLKKRSTVNFLFWKCRPEVLCDCKTWPWWKSRGAADVQRRDCVSHCRTALSPQTRNGCLVMRVVGGGGHRCRCRLEVPLWVLRGQDPPPWPQRYPAAHLSDSPSRPLSSCSWCRWPLYSPLKATKNRCTANVWSSVSGPTALEPVCGAFSLPSRSTWRWQVSYRRWWQVTLSQANIAR